MSTGIIVAIVIVALVIIAVAVWVTMEGRRRALRDRFGPEYDRLARERGSKRAAEAELTQRQRHLDELGIRPLSPEQRSRYSSEWMVIQEGFVERPREALNAATGLITAAMRDRGYPTEHYEQIVADLSVDHARTMDQFRMAHDISVRADRGSASTEDLRQAMIAYRTVFQDLAGTQAAEARSGETRAGAARDTAAGGPAAAEPGTQQAPPGWEPGTQQAPPGWGRGTQRGRPGFGSGVGRTGDHEGAPETAEGSPRGAGQPSQQSASPQGTPRR